MLTYGGMPLPLGTKRALAVEAAEESTTLSPKTKQRQRVRAEYPTKTGSYSPQGSEFTLHPPTGLIGSSPPMTGPRVLKSVKAGVIKQASQRESHPVSSQH